LQTGDADLIRQVFAGHSNKQKVSETIKTYIKKKYFELKDVCNNFNKTILAKVKKYWDIELSEEYLRKIFREADKEAVTKEGSELLAVEKETPCLSPNISGSPLAATVNPSPEKMAEETTPHEATCNDSCSTVIMAPNKVPVSSSPHSTNLPINELSKETKSREISWEESATIDKFLPINVLKSSVVASRDQVQDSVAEEIASHEEVWEDSTVVMAPNKVPVSSNLPSAILSTNVLCEGTESRDIGWEESDSKDKLCSVNIQALPLAISTNPGIPWTVKESFSREVCWGINCLPGLLPVHNSHPYNSINEQLEPPVATQYNELFERIGEFPYSGSKIGDKKRFCHHLGLVLVSPWLDRFSQALEEYLPQPLCKSEYALIRQFQAQILLGAVNHEQSLELSFSSLEFLVGPCYRAPDYQRTQLNSLLTQQCFKGLWRANAEIIGLFSRRILYYDPHVKKYTGILKVIKSWCGSIGRITDVMNIDFFHDQNGNPCYAEHFDGYYDQRERLFLCIDNFLKVFPEFQNEELLLIFDQGLYSLALMHQLRARNLHFMTWDKDFNEEEFQEFHPKSHEFYHSILRNHSDDFIFTHFIYYEQTWKRDHQFRQIVFCATSDKGRSIKPGWRPCDP